MAKLWLNELDISQTDPWYLIIDSPRSGQYNMDRDYELAQLSCQGKFDYPILRIYQFEKPVITIGHLQNTNSLNTKLCSENNIDIVKRPTGGRAILHDEEITYSVIIPKQHKLAQVSISKSYLILSTALIKGFLSLGINSKLLPGDRGYIKNPSCFSSSSKYEIAIEGKKFIGSAQKRYKNCLLQQGSILTGKGYLELGKYIGADLSNEKSGCISDFLNRRPHRFELEKAIIQGFENSLNISFIDILKI